MLHNKLTSAASLFLLLAALVACGKSEPAPKTTTDPAATLPRAEGEHTAITTDKIEPYECGTITRLHTYKGVFLASQPAAEDFEQAKKGGVKTVINLRHAAENKAFDEKEVVEMLELTYHNVPWNGPDELTDEKFDAVRALLRDEERPILLHCSSANRAGAMWLAYRVLDDGATYDEALAEAKTVGMKTPALEEKAKDYIERNKQ